MGTHHERTLAYRTSLRSFDVDDLPELVEDVSDIIGNVSPFETPLLDHLGDPKRSAMSTVHECRFAWRWGAP